MKAAWFRYQATQTIEEALAMLAEYAPDDGRVLAGGQSLVPTMAFRLARPHHLVDINGIEALRRLAIDRKSTRLNSSHANISYAVFFLKKKKQKEKCYSYKLIFKI